ncbi:hypothetical protein PG994_004993 [Apiospora phragmitis]|uniref:Transmembrane protein n=1 Tax=Apiospora phragmitis TaxID=2905665 RepID=A0ABR1VS51_9PEZI
MPPRPLDSYALAAVLFSFAFSHFAAAFDPSRRKCSTLCFTSFVWCDPDQTDGKEEADCSFPPNVYPQRDPFTATAAIVLGEEYTISWTNRSPRAPVFISNPQKILDAFPAGFLAVPDGMTKEAAMLGAMTDVVGMLCISQPRAASTAAVDGKKVQVPAARSSQFFLQTAAQAEVLDTTVTRATRALQRRWTVGVGAGAGVLLAVGLVAAALVAWRCGWWTTKRRRQARTTRRAEAYLDKMTELESVSPSVGQTPSSRNLLETRKKRMAGVGELPA